MVVRALTAVLLVALLSGCVTPDDNVDRSAVTGGTPPTGAAAGSPSTHRDPGRDESGVSMGMEGDQHVAVQTITLTNDFGGASGAIVELTTRAGGIVVGEGNGGGYRIVVLLKSRADTESAARAGLERLSVSHDDDLGDNLELATEVHFPDSSNGLSGGITAYLPRSPAYRLDLDTSSGGIAVEDLMGPSIDAQTSSGGIAIKGSYTTIAATASSGGIAIEAKARDVDALTGSGCVAAKLQPMGSGSWRLEAGSGGVALQVQRGNAGYDVEADTGSGNVAVAMRATEEVGDQGSRHVHVRTTGYEDAGTQVVVTAKSGSGGVAVADD